MQDQALSGDGSKSDQIDTMEMKRLKDEMTSMKKKAMGKRMLVESQPFNSHVWPRHNFSSQHQRNIKQTSDENKEKYRLGDCKWIQYQILQTNMTRTVWQTVSRITIEILGVKGLNHTFFFFCKNLV